MGQNQGGDGKGQSKFRTTRDDDDARRAAKGRRKGRRGPRDGRPEGGTLIEGVREDRAAAREEQRQANLERAYGTTLGHLQRFGAKEVPGNSAMRPRWDVDALDAVQKLARLYFFGAEADGLNTQEEIETREAMMGRRVVDEVRRRFAGTCHLNGRISGTPGQNQPWFADAKAKAKEFHDKRRAERAQADTATATEATDVVAAEAEPVVV